MLFKVAVLALAVSAVSAQTCGQPAIKPDLSGFNQLIHAISKNGKIVGGTEAVPHSWPWQVIMTTSSGSQLCGGSILNDNWIMTAAHCCVAVNTNPATYRVRVGAHNWRQAEPSAATLELSRVVVHPGYVARPVPKNDFCLLKLKEPLTQKNEVSTVCLPTAEEGATGDKCWVTGWGSTRAVGKSFEEYVKEILAAEAAGQVAPSQTRVSPHLRQVDVQVTDQATCNTAYSGMVSADMICGDAPGKDSCQGDSGGPFVCEVDGQWKMVGVVSWGRGCAKPGFPGVYGRTAYVLDWINGLISS